VKLASLEAIIAALNRNKVRYLIVGGLAVAAHGFGRVTFDVDLVVQLQPENVQQAMRALEALGYKPVAPVSASDFADPNIRAAWIREKNMVVFGLQSSQHRDTPVDVFVTEPFDFNREYEAALVGEIMPGVQARFVRQETLIRMKEAAGREKDREDVQQLRALSEHPDEIE
jgi:predicted nucleotidyltransferase